MHAPSLPSPLFVALPGAPFGPFLAVLLAVGVLSKPGGRKEDEAAQECWKAWQAGNIGAAAPIRFVLTITSSTVALIKMVC